MYIASFELTGKLLPTAILPVFVNTPSVKSVTDVEMSASLLTSGVPSSEVLCIEYSLTKSYSVLKEDIVITKLQFTAESAFAPLEEYAIYCIGDI